jgi:hypothetical protein
MGANATFFSENVTDPRKMAAGREQDLLPQSAVLDGASVSLEATT